MRSLSESARRRTQAVPFDITHTTVNFSVSLRQRRRRWVTRFPARSVTLYGANRAMVGSGTTGDDGSVAIKVARAGVEREHGARPASRHEDYDVAGDDMTDVTWDPQMFAVARPRTPTTSST